jgi:hypothetical protein
MKYLVTMTTHVPDGRPDEADSDIRAREAAHSKSLRRAGSCCGCRGRPCSPASCLLGNGWCTRPPQLDCAFESICETCSYFQTSIEFRPTLQAQHDDAYAKNQTHRASLFSSLITHIDQGQAS